MSNLDCFVRLHRIETLTISKLCHGFKLKTIPWISKQLSMSNQNYIFSKFMFWIFNDFVISVLVANFYITEGEGTGTQTLYYTKYDWKILEEIGKKQMNQNFMIVSLIFHIFIISFHLI